MGVAQDCEQVSISRVYHFNVSLNPFVYLIVFLTLSIDTSPFVNLGVLPTFFTSKRKKELQGPADIKIPLFERVWNSLVHFYNDLLKEVCKSGANCGTCDQFCA